jgi:hypothetical protein
LHCYYSIPINHGNNSKSLELYDKVSRLTVRNAFQAVRSQNARRIDDDKNRRPYLITTSANLHCLCFFERPGAVSSTVTTPLNVNPLPATFTIITLCLPFALLLGNLFCFRRYYYLSNVITYSIIEILTSA